MSDLQLPRRSFLRAFAALPLIGGGVKLLGDPTAAAVPVSAALLRRYFDFLSRELFACQIELRLLEDERLFHDMGLSLTDSSTWRRMPLWWELPDDPLADAIVTQSPASARAAVVVSAAGIPLTALAGRPAGPDPDAIRFFTATGGKRG